MLTAIDIISTTIYGILGILFISKFYPFRDKLKIRIPICIGILVAHSVLNLYFVVVTQGAAKAPLPHGQINGFDLLINKMNTEVSPQKNDSLK